MTSPLHKAIKQFLKDVNDFLTNTLKNETSNKSVLKEKTKLIDSLQKLYSDFTELKPTPEKEETTNPLLSGTSQSSEDGYTNEYNIPQTTVAALKEPTKIGYLFQRKQGEGKQKKFKQKEAKKYCVIHENIMYWFLKPSDKTFHGAVYLNECVLEDVSRKEKDFLFQLMFPSNRESYEFQADNRADLSEWMKAVENGIQCGKQKEANGEKLHQVGGVSMKSPSEITYINEIPPMEEFEETEYVEPQDVRNTIGIFEKNKRDFGASIPRERAPLPPPVTETAKLPSKGKAAKEPKPASTKKIETAAPAEPHVKVNKSPVPKESKTPTKDKPFVFSSAGKPKTVSEVKLKRVSMPAGLRLREEENTATDEENIYDTVDTKVSSARGLSIPSSKPPKLPQRGGHTYANQESDDLVYEIV